METPDVTAQVEAVREARRVLAELVDKDIALREETTKARTASKETLEAAIKGLHSAEDALFKAVAEGTPTLPDYVT